MPDREDAISDTPPLAPLHQTHCAWLKDVLISAHNSGQNRSQAPSLIGRACALCPAAMADSGAAVSLIGTELLPRPSLPPDAVAEFRWSRSRVSEDICVVARAKSNSPS